MDISCFEYHNISIFLILVIYNLKLLSPKVVFLILNIFSFIRIIDRLQQFNLKHKLTISNHSTAQQAQQQNKVNGRSGAQINYNIQQIQSQLSQQAGNINANSEVASNNPSQINPQNLQPQLASSGSPMLKIQADNQDPKIICISRILMVLIILTIFFVRFALPPTFITMSNQTAFKGTQEAKGCNPSAFDPQNRVYCLNYSSSNPVLGVFLPELKAQNQFVLLYLELTKQIQNVSQYSINQQVQLFSYQLSPLINQQTGQKQLFLHVFQYNKTVNYKITIQNYMNYEEIEPSPTGRRRFLIRHLFAYVRLDIASGEQSDKLILVKFSDYGQTVTGIQKISLQGLSINPNFTKFTIIIRAVFCGIAIIRMIVFLRRYLQLEPGDRILEIKLVAIMSILLVFFNDPFYAITVLKTGAAAVFFSSLFVICFLIFLQMFWVFMLRRIYYEHQQKSTELFGLKRSWPFYLIFLAMFILCIILFIQYSMYALQRVPVMLYANLVQMKVIPTIITLAVLMVGISIYQVIIFCLLMKKYACSEQTMLWRHKYYLQHYPFFFIIFIIFFSAGGAMPYSYEGVWILYGYSFINLFAFAMQFMYYTPKSELNKNQNGHLVEKFSVSSDQVFEANAGQVVEKGTNLEQQS